MSSLKNIPVSPFNSLLWQGAGLVLEKDRLALLQLHPPSPWATLQGQEGVLREVALQLRRFDKAVPIRQGWKCEPW